MTLFDRTESYQKTIAEGRENQVLPWTTRDRINVPLLEFEQMLAVLGCFQLGDSKKLDEMAEWAASSDYPMEYVGILRRLAEAAKIMEADDHA